MTQNGAEKKSFDLGAAALDFASPKCPPQIPLAGRPSENLSGRGSSQNVYLIQDDFNFILIPLFELGIGIPLLLCFVSR